MAHKSTSSDVLDHVRALNILQLPKQYYDSEDLGHYSTNSEVLDQGRTIPTGTHRYNITTT